jgi:hypothetical protein
MNVVEAKCLGERYRGTWPAGQATAAAAGGTESIA